MSAFMVGGSVVLALLLVGGCSNSSKAPSRSSCSVGPDYPAGTVFPNEYDESTYPDCALRCSPGRASPKPQSLEALPSGSCDVEGERCGMLIQYFCPPDQAILGRVDRMRCSCTSGSWTCVTALQGAGLCPPLASDSGASRSDGGG